MVVRGEIAGVGEELAVGERDDVVVLPGEDPGAVGAVAVGEARRLDGVERLLDLLVGHSRFGKLLADLLGILLPLLEHADEVAAGQEDEDLVVALVEAGDGRSDEAAEARSLDGDPRRINERQRCRGIARPAHVGHRLPNRRHEHLRTRLSFLRPPGPVVGHLHHEGMDTMRRETAGHDPPHRHPAPRFVNDDAGGATADFSLAIAGLIPLHPDVGIAGGAGGERRGEADAEVAVVPLSLLDRHVELGPVPAETIEADAGVVLGLLTDGERVDAPEHGSGHGRRLRVLGWRCRRSAGAGHLFEELGKVEPDARAFRRGLFVRGVGDVEDQLLRHEENVVEIRLHRHRPIHEMDGGLLVDLPKLLLDPLAETQQPVAGREDNRIGDPGAEELVPLTRLDELDPFRRCRHADALPRFAVGEHVVVFARPRALGPERHHLVERRAFLHRPAHERRHRHALPLPLAAAPHLAERDPLGIHAADAPDEPGIPDRHERDLPLWRHDKCRGGVLKADLGHVVEDAAVVERAIGRRRPGDGKSGAVEELRKNVHDRDEPRIEMERCGERLGLAEMALWNVGGEPGRGVVELLAKPRSPADRLHRTDDMEHRIDAAIGLDGKQLAVGPADLLRAPVERHDPQALGPLELPVRHRAGCCRRRRQLGPWQGDLEGPTDAAAERPLDLVAWHLAHLIAGEVVDGEAVARLPDGEIELHLFGVGADPPASVVEVEPAVTTLVAPIVCIVLHAKEADQEPCQRCRRGLEKEWSGHRDLRRRRHEPGADAGRIEMVGRIGRPPADVDDLVFGEGERRGIGAPPEHQGVIVVRHFQVVGVGVEALELDRHLHRLAAAADRHRPFNGEGLAGTGEAFPQRPQIGGERPGGIPRRIDGRRLFGADRSDPEGTRQAGGQGTGQEKRHAGRAGGDHENLLGGTSGAGKPLTSQSDSAQSPTLSRREQAGFPAAAAPFRGALVPRKRCIRAAAVWARGEERCAIIHQKSPFY